MKKLNFQLLVLLISALSIIGCTDKEDEKSTLQLDFTGLENLGATANYEGWLIVDGSPITTGVFSVNDQGVASKTSFDIDADMLERATTFVLTIEPNPDNDPMPSDIHILAGDFSGNSSNLTIGHGAALGHDFKSASGSYILATPTDGNPDIDETSGVWFVDPSGPSATLNLPTLPAGWKYEGWAVIGGSPVSTGTFTSVSGADDAAPYSGTAGAPPFPGEDFLLNAPSGLTFPTTLEGGAIVISIEPYPDNSPAPFRLKPLLGEVAIGAATHSLTSMSNNIANTGVSGTAIR